MTVALFWLKKFLQLNSANFKHYSHDAAGATAFYNDIVARLFVLVPVAPKEFTEGVIGVQTTNRKLYSDAMWDVAANKANYSGIITIDNAKPKPKSTLKVPAYRACLLGNDDANDENAFNLPSKSTFLIDLEHGIMSKDDALHCRPSWFEKYPDLVKSYASRETLAKIKEVSECASGWPLLLVTYAAAYKNTAESVVTPDYASDSGSDTDDVETTSSEENKSTTSV